MADELAADLQLDISPALSSVEELGSSIDAALLASVDSFSTEMQSAIDGVPPIDLESNAEAIPADIEAAIGGADSTVVMEGDAGAIPGEIDAAIGSADATVPIDADPGPAMSEFDALLAAFDAAGPTILVDADTAEAEAAIEGLGDSAETASGQIDTGSASVSGMGAASDLAQGSAVGLGSAIGEVGGGAGTAVGLVTAFAAGIGVMYNEAVEATGASQRFQSQLGGMADEVESLSSIRGLNTNLGDLALTLGSDDDKIRNVVARLFDLASSSGIAKGRASEFVQQMVAMGARAVALNPELGDVGDVTDSLSTALVRGGRFASKYGLDLSQADINARALNDTHKTSTSELSFVEKAMAGAALASEKYGDDLSTVIAEGSENAITKQRRLKQTVLESIEALGMPLVAPIFDVLEAGIPVAESFGRVLSELAQAGLPLLSVALEAVVPLVVLLADVLETIGPGGLQVVAALVGMYVAARNFERIWRTVTTLLSANPYVIAAVGILSVASALGVLDTGAGGSTRKYQDLTDAIVENNGALDENSRKSIRAALEADGQTDDLNRAKVGFDQYTAAIGSASDATNKSLDPLEKYLTSVSLSRDTNDEWVGAMKAISPELGAMAAQLVRTGEANDGLKKKIVDQVIASQYAGQVSRDRRKAGSDETAMLEQQANAEAAETAIKKLQTDATKAHSDTMIQASSAYASMTLAIGAQAAADANSVAAANAAALANRSRADSTAAVAQENLGLAIAEDAAVMATARYQTGQGTAKEATDAVSTAVGLLRNELSLLSGNYYGSQSAQLTLEQQSLQFNDTLNAQNGTLGANRLEVISSQQALLGMGNAANTASTAALQNGESIQNQIAPLQNYQAELETVKLRLIATGDEGGTAFVQSLQDANARAIGNLQASQPGFENAGNTAVGGAVSGARNQGGNFAGANREVGQQGTSGLAAGTAGMPGVAAGSVLESVNAAAMAGANAHNVGYGIGASFSEGIGDGMDANAGYIRRVAAGLIDEAASAARARAEVASPSKLFAREVGLPIAQGIALGMEQGTKEVARASAGQVATARMAALEQISIAEKALIHARRVASLAGGDPNAALFAAQMERNLVAVRQARDAAPSFTFDIDVHGVTEPAVGRNVGEQIGEGAVDALTRRGYTVTARMG